MFTFNIDNATSVKQILPFGNSSPMQSILSGSGNVLSNKGIRVEATVPIGVAYKSISHNKIQAASVVSKGTNALGREFRGGSHPNREVAPNIPFDYSSTISFMAMN